MADPDFPHLSGAERTVARWALSPPRLIYCVLAAAILLAWLMLIGAARVGGPPGFPDAGQRWLEGLPEMPLPGWARTAAALCLGTTAPGTGFYALSSLTLMWFLMAAATMLPSALPMVRTYCEITDTAHAKSARVVSPLVLVAGYLTLWLACSVAFAALTLALRPLLGERAISPAAAAVLAAAGLYQFSGLKHACLEKCRNPFGVLFARWSDRPARVFRLGAEQGVWCLGCCWALMLVMFAVGLMNVLWMALIGLFALVEKQVTSKVPSYLAGAILLVWSAALLVLSL